MGSAGSGGGGGQSHTGGGAGLVGGTAGGGTYRFDGGRMRGGELSDPKAAAIVGRLIDYFRRKGPYIRKFVESEGFATAYECVFHLVDFATGRRTETQFATAMGLGGEHGLLAWSTKAGDRCAENERDREVADLMRALLDEFALQAAGDDLDVYLGTSGSRLLREIDKDYIKHAANHFLALCIRDLFTLNTERLPEAAGLKLDVLAQRLADQLVTEYEQTGERVSYRALAGFLRHNPGWFLDHLKL